MFNFLLKHHHIDFYTIQVKFLGMFQKLYILDIQIFKIMLIRINTYIKIINKLIKNISEFFRLMKMSKNTRQLEVF